MPIFKDFAENGDLLQSREEPLTETNFERYIAENGLEKTIGYLEAIVDFNKQLTEIFFVQDGSLFFPKRSKTILENGNEIFNQNIQFIKFAQEVIRTKIKQENGTDMSHKNT